MSSRILIVLLSLAAPALAQAQQLTLKVECYFDVPGITSKLDNEDKTIRESLQKQESVRYVREIGRKLRFWKFTSTDVEGAGLFRIRLEPEGVGDTTRLIAYADLQLPGDSTPRIIWTPRTLLESKDLKDRVSNTEISSTAVLQGIASDLFQKFTGPDFRTNVGPLFQQAWVSQGILTQLPDGTVSFPLPWNELKESRLSRFLMECLDAAGAMVRPAPEADGLDDAYTEPMNKIAYLRARPVQPLRGMRVRFVYVKDWQERPVSNPDFAVVP